MGRSIKVFHTSQSFWKDEEVSVVVEQFKKYKSEQNTPISFGRDAPLVRPSDAKYAGLQHLHLGSFNAITNQYHRTSDSWLIYTSGFDNPHFFLLIDILTPDAHEEANNIDLMNRYIAFANSFRQEH
ncbi:type II toxin-antitoxin system YafO family toxin [Shewanella gelidii]|uniref:Type II toxin-antitoxin system YafO family toxin n=1 Tax=Shewanella gelidii TaxID=1642821 RepID=A0A917JTF1_9GAMM|nr:type II toxin-antitoxin system YafO family toxin [Shewanella gelidii]MCL1098055.1 type II toxin-antitoxin system YafO family toxin [Shewanella gelidii]GGI85796.1 hypothetical protein GCM10009332_23860 [Shewanella gelidii]